MERNQLVKLHARIGALEQLVSQLLFMAAQNAGDPIKELSAYRDRLSQELAEASMPRLDPALSDAYTQELAEAVDSILAALIDRLRREEASS